MRFTRSLALVVAFGCLCTAVAGQSQDQKAWLEQATRYEKNGWIYLHIAGEPRQRGYQHGYLLAKEISETLRIRRVVWKHISGMDWEWLVGKSKALFTPKVDAENVAEIDGIVDGMADVGFKSNRDELIAYNGWFDLVYYWWPIEKKKSVRFPKSASAVLQFLYRDGIHNRRQRHRAGPQHDEPLPRSYF